MNKIEIYSYLKEQNIEYEAAEHKAVFNMKELETIELPHPDNTDCVLYHLRLWKSYGISCS